VIFTSRHACLEVKFGFKKKIGSLSEGSVPVIFISMFTTEFLAGKFVMFGEDKMIYFVCLNLERAFLFTKYPLILRYNDWLVF
jgi:hypothetical protein